MQWISYCKSRFMRLIIEIKFLTLMRASVTLAFVTILGLTAARGQSITLSVHDATLEHVLKEVEKQTTFHFIYSKETIELSVPVTIEADKEVPAIFLKRIFDKQPLTYSVEEHFIIIKARKESATHPKIVQDISGKVVGENNEPLAGVTVSVKGTKQLTTTDDNGNFFFSDIDPDAILIITGAELDVKEINIARRNFLTVNTRSRISNLDETVVKGYYITPRKLNTGSVSKINSANISEQPVSNPIAAMQGRASGVFVTTENGLPGGNITVQIRGQGSINAGTQPLYIIDGVPFLSTPLNYDLSILATGIGGLTSPLNSLNAEDIESIIILKDADATAIYGSRGANGVVLITTKKGKPGKTKVDFNYYAGASRLAGNPSFLSLKDYLAIRREAYDNDGIIPAAADAPDLLLWDTTKATNWTEYFLGGTAFTSQGQLQISGGTATTNFLISGDYRKEGSILPGDQHYTRSGVHFQFHHQSLSNKFSLDFSGNFSSDKNRQLSTSVLSFLTLPPDIPLYKSDGSVSWEGYSGIQPVTLLSRKSVSQTESLLSNLQLRYQISRWLTAKVSLGYTSIDLSQVMTFPHISLDPSSGSLAYSNFGDNRNKSYITEPQLEFNKKIGGVQINSIFGASWQQSLREGSFIYATNFSNEDLLEYSGAAGTVYVSGLYQQYKYASAFARLGFSYKDKYVINATGRRDGSSRFGPDKQFGNFGALGAAWIFSAEEIFKRNLKWLSYGKLRASYGITGNDQISDYAFLSSYSTGSVYQQSPGLAPVRIANDKFGWETNKKLEIALELAVFKNRLSLVTGWYRNRSGNQLIQYPLPYTSGSFGSYTTNFPALVENKGWEFDISATPVSNSNYSLTVAANLSVPVNRLLKYPGLAASGFSYLYEIGKDLAIRKGFHFEDIDRQTGLPVYTDVNKDGFISAQDDYQVIGRLSPSYFGGAGTEFKFHQFTLNVFFQFAKRTVQGLPSIPGLQSNFFSMTVSRWQKPGDNTNIPKATTVPGEEYFNLLQSNAILFNGGYTRLKNLSISWSVKEKSLQHLKLSQLKIFMECQNLITWRKSGSFYDPETGISGMPPLKVIVAGFHLQF